MDHAPTRSRRWPTLAWFYLAGLASSVLTAWVLSTSVEPSRGARTQFVGYEGLNSRRLTLTRTWWAQQVILEAAGVPAWHAMQALGPPDTPRMGDIQSAWASQQQDNQDEWLELTYPTPVQAVRIDVYETNAPGALSKIDSIAPDGKATTLWTGSDPAAPVPGGVFVARVPVAPAGAIARIRLSLDSMRVPGWNEIDAVALIDAGGNATWASSAAASSNYGQLLPDAPGFAELEAQVPYWSRRRDWPSGPGASVATAYGLPMLCMWGPPHPTGRTLESLPLRPAWRGLLVNGILHGVVLAALWFSTVGVRRFIRQARWLRRGCCMHCGYDLRWELSKGCPECGWKRDPARQSP